MATRCFWIERTETERVSLRRYADVALGDCPAHGLHQATAFVCDRGGHSATTMIMPEHATRIELEHGVKWPAACDCGYVFTQEDERQVFTVSLFADPAGDLRPLHDWPAGAMWDATWMSDYWKAADGRCLVVRLPNGYDWMIDSRASNCGLPDDDVHQCWVRHGEPPELTVNKNGNTCEAGGGSIWSRQGKPDDWHGFLTGGVLHLAGEAPVV